MVTFCVRRRAFGAVAVLTGLWLAAGAEAQTSTGSDPQGAASATRVFRFTTPIGTAPANSQAEAQLLSQITQQPRQISNYLDLARLYFEQRRFDDAEQILMRALALVDRERQMGPPTVAVPTIPPVGVPTAGQPSLSGSAPVRVGGDVREPKKIRHVPPVYPPEAQAARISGLVIIEAIIDVQGNVSDAKILRSVPALDQAALDAVRQWQFTPTMLNGVLVPVIMTVTVNFTISQ
jgi:TonB family protein